MSVRFPQDREPGAHGPVEGGGPAPDPVEFRRVMGLFATGVTVVTACLDGEVHGMTANAVMSVSLDPLLVCVSVNRRARMDAVLQRTGAYALNILTDDQEAVSQYYAGNWPYASPPEHRLESWIGGPRLIGCLAAVGCQAEKILDGGDHHLYLGRVLALHRGAGRLSPLLFFGGRYHRVREPEVTPRDPIEVWKPEEVRIFYDG
jgi:flavin reductase (DIM6/NTAB) family NADH-FMN oxidoreductase RutF